MKHEGPIRCCPGWLCSYKTPQESADDVMKGLMMGCPLLPLGRLYTLIYRQACLRGSRAVPRPPLDGSLQPMFSLFLLFLTSLNSPLFNLCSLILFGC